VIHDAGSSDQPQNNANNINGLAFYYEIRWGLIFSDAAYNTLVYDKQVFFQVAGSGADPARPTP
jgi:hypothetical protein